MWPDKREDLSLSSLGLCTLTKCSKEMKLW